MLCFKKRHTLSNEGFEDCFCITSVLIPTEEDSVLRCSGSEFLCLLIVDSLEKDLEVDELWMKLCVFPFPKCSHEDFETEEGWLKQKNQYAHE